MPLTPARMPLRLAAAVTVALAALTLLAAPLAHAGDDADGERLARMRSAHADADATASGGGVEAQQASRACFDDVNGDVVDERTESPATQTLAARADIISHCAVYVDNLALQVQVEAPSNPRTDVNWQRGTFVGWFLDTTGDGEGDFFASYNLGTDGNLRTEVQRLEGEQSEVTCGNLSAVYDGESFTAGPIPPSCLDDATTVSVAAATFYDLAGGQGPLFHDTAPEPGAFTQDIERSTACEQALDAPFADREQIAEVHREAVDCLFARGITLGSIVNDIRIFAPTAGITRAQFSGFTFRALQTAGTDLPAAQTPRFSDVPPGHVFDEEIHRLAAAEILLGRTPQMFVPNGLIRRDQTASVLLRSLEHVRGQEITAVQPGTYFSDIAASFHEENIDAAFEEGLVEGVDAPNGGLGRYAPFQNTSRQQMASVVHRFVQTVEGS